MMIYDALKKDHEKVSKLLDQLVECSESGDDRWKDLVTEIRDELIPHSRAEEAVFYNGIREASEEGGKIVRGYAEHAVAETELRALQAMKSVDVNFSALARKLRDDLNHHVREEETEIFAAGKKVFSDAEAKQIGDAFRRLKPMIREQSLAGTTLDLIANLLPRRLADGFRTEFTKKVAQQTAKIGKDEGKGTEQRSA